MTRKNAPPMESTSTTELFCSRFRTTRREAERDARGMRKHGGRSVAVAGKRGLWRVRVKMPLAAFAEFIQIEAERESRREARVT